MNSENDCKVCKGTGIYISNAFSFEGKDYPERKRACSACNGKGSFPAFDLGKLRADLFSSRGKKEFRKAFNAKLDHYKDNYAATAYYVWRMVQFHSGRDMTMPLTASMLSRGCPYMAQLDALADSLAKECYGDNMRAARAWGRAMGMV